MKVLSRLAAGLVVAVGVAVALVLLVGGSSPDPAVVDAAGSAAATPPTRADAAGPATTPSAPATVGHAVDGSSPGSTDTATSPATSANVGRGSSATAVASAAGGPAADRQRLPIVRWRDLPPEAEETWRLVLADGPYPYLQDGTVFGNRERLLPLRERGYYREFTVPTPEERDRGARRLVVGNEDEVYFTADHYESFSRVDVGR